MKQSKLHANSFHVGFIKTVWVCRSTVNSYILGSQVQSWIISFCIRVCYPWWTNDGTHERARDVSTSNGRWNSGRGKRNTVRSTSHTRHMTTRAWEILGWWFLHEFWFDVVLWVQLSLQRRHIPLGTIPAMPHFMKHYFRILGSGDRFSKVPKCFRTRKGVVHSKTLWLQGCFIHVFLILTEIALIQEVSGV